MKENIELQTYELHKYKIASKPIFLFLEYNHFHPIWFHFLLDLVSPIGYSIETLLFNHVPAVAWATWTV